MTVRSTKSRPHGLYITGFIGQYKIDWLVDTGAVRNILSYECYTRLPEAFKFPLHEDGSQVFVADGRRTNTYGTGEMTVRIGTQDVSLSVLVADIEDTATNVMFPCFGSSGTHIKFYKTLSGHVVFFHSDTHDNNSAGEW